MTEETQTVFHDNRTVDVNGFVFKCHPGVSCYLVCCHKVELRLFPYDILRLKQRLQLSSTDFLEKYTRIGTGAHPYFPSVMLNMVDTEEYPCPFLVEKGCSVYSDRPSSCRTYPLERAVEKTDKRRFLKSHYFLTEHSYCKGHLEDERYTIKRWERDQRLLEFNLLNDRWAEVDAFFATNPWQGEGHAGPRQQLAFMVCYNVDAFKEYAIRHQLVKKFRLNRDQRRRIAVDEVELLKFGFDWLLHVLGDRRTLVTR